MQVAMHVPSPTPGLTAEHRRALTVLASSRAGMSELLFIARGFSVQVLTELLQAGFVSAERRQTRVRGRDFLVRRLQITDAGQQARRATPPP